MSKRLFAPVLAVMMIGALLASAARGADEPAKDAKAYVVIVGINDYADKQIKPRKHAEDDAKALYDLFTDTKYLGAEVKLLLGTKDEQRKAETATKDNILKAISWVAGEAKRDDLCVFVLIGSGSPVGDRTCLFATDSTFKGRAKDAVVAGDIETKLEKFKSQRVCAFVDINMKGFDSGKEAVAEPSATDMVRVFVGNEDKEEHALPPGRVIFVATTTAGQSIDLKDHGLFASVLLTAFKGGADKEGYEADGVVTVDELIENVEKELPRQARLNGTTRQEKEQFPLVWGGRSSHFPVSKNPEVTPVVEKRVKTLEQLLKDKKLETAIGEEGIQLVSRMPKLKAQQELRKSYQQLADGKLSVEDFLKSRTDILASTKLKKSEAVDYASKVMKGIKIIQEDYVTDLTDGQMVNWAVRGLYRRLDVKMPDDIKQRLEKIKDMKQGELLNLLADVRENFGKREDLANNKDVDLSLQQMLFNLDPYTNYFDPEMVRRMKTEMHGRFTGIGIQIRKDLARDELLVVTPIKGSPAYKAGIKAGDIITRVLREMDSDGKKLDPPEILETKGMSLNDAVAKILGTPGTKVKIEIDRDGKKLEFDITRGAVEVESVFGVERNEDDSWDFLIDTENKIGYVRLTGFQKNTYRDLRRAMNELLDKGLKGFVLDLRFNPGGLLESSVYISDLFIDDGAIVEIRPRAPGEPLKYRGKQDGSLLDFPMVCLVNGGSASASEIVSACLQDHHRAVIIGERSYGKGSVQNVVPFSPTGGEIKLTTASFWRPTGKNLNRSSTKGGEDEDWGVVPDKVVKLTRRDRDALADHLRDQEIIPNRSKVEKPKKEQFRDLQLDDALEYLRGMIKTAGKTPGKKAG